MRLNPALKIPFIFTAFIGIALLLFFSCQKQISADYLGPEPPNLTTKVSSSIAGFVTDENDLEVGGAEVTVGSSTAITDKYGFFEINNVQVVKDAAVVSVIRPGYFKAIKTYLAASEKSAFFRIKLIPKINGGTINATSGGNVALANGLIVELPAAGVVNAATNTLYTGQVNVAAHWINPTGNELNRTMPGDLRGIDTAGEFKLLTTYGMAAVELTGTGGELLQVAPGKKATLTMPLPPALSASAPSVIPLWYFDENTGLWKEEGHAVKVGNNYVGEVGHFSYWNYDMPSNYVRFNCTVTNGKGMPIKNVLVRVSVAGSPQSFGFGYTDSSGYTGGAVPNNASLVLEVFGDYNCLAGLAAKNFNTGTTDISLGRLVVQSGNDATITGNVTDCANAAVNNGFILMRKDGLSFYQALDKTGGFNFTTTLCSSNAAVTFIAEDKTGQKASAAMPFTINAGDNAIGTLAACALNTNEFINYKVNGTNYSYSAPTDSLFQYAKPQNTPPTTIVTAASRDSLNAKHVALGIIQTGISLNSTQSLRSFECPQIDIYATIANPITVKITEYGIVGQFMAGNFTGTFTGPAPGNIQYNVTCIFRIRRNM